MTKAEQRRQVVEEFERSGLSRGEFCSERNLSVGTLDNWRRKVRRTTFVRLQLAQAAVQSGLTLILTNGRRIETRGSFDEQELARLIRAAEA